MLDGVQEAEGLQGLRARLGHLTLVMQHLRQAKECLALERSIVPGFGERQRFLEGSRCLGEVALLQRDLSL